MKMGSADESFSNTGYEPKDYFLTETHVEFNQESITEQRFTEQRLPSMFDRTEQPVVETMAQSHDRTEQPVFETGQEQNPGLAQIRTLLYRQREQILADCQAEIRKHEFQADCDRRSIQKFSETIESQQEELRRALAEELHRRDQQLLHEQLLEQNWDLREAHEKSQRNGRIEEVSRVLPSIRLREED